MPFQSAPECVEVVLHGTVGTKDVANVFHAWKPGGYIQSDLDSLAQGVDTEANALYPALLGEGVSYQSTSVRGLEKIVDLYSSFTGGPTPGTSGPITLPSNTLAAMSPFQKLRTVSRNWSFHSAHPGGKPPTW